MIAHRNTVAAFALLMASLPASVHAQDVPGIEICTVEKTMERRTSCLQSNVDFLQKTITKLTTDHQQKIDASNRQIEALKNAVIGLKKVVSELQASQGKAKTRRRRRRPQRGMLHLLQRMRRRRRKARSSRSSHRHDTRNCSITALSGS